MKKQSEASKRQQLCLQIEQNKRNQANKLKQSKIKNSTQANKFQPIDLPPINSTSQKSTPNFSETNAQQIDQSIIQDSVLHQLPTVVSSTNEFFTQHTTEIDYVQSIDNTHNSELVREENLISEQISIINQPLSSVNKQLLTPVLNIDPSLSISPPCADDLPLAIDTTLVSSSLPGVTPQLAADTPLSASSPLKIIPSISIDTPLVVNAQLEANPPEVTGIPQTTRSSPEIAPPIEANPIPSVNPSSIILQPLPPDPICPPSPSISDSTFDSLTPTPLFDLLRSNLSASSFNSLIKILSLYTTGIISLPEAISLSSEIPQVPLEFKEALESREKNRRENSWFLKKVNEKTTKGMERVTRSYVRMDDEYMETLGQQREDIINRRYVAVDPRKEEGCGVERISKHENVMFKIEDERYEMDRKMYFNGSVIEKLEREGRIEERELKWVRKVVKNAKIVEGLRDGKREMIETVLKSLREYGEGMKARKERMVPIWKEEIEKNWELSLDYKGFNCKEIDKQSQNPKELLAQIKKVMNLRSKMKDLIKSQEIMDFIKENDREDLENLRKLLRVNHVDDIDEITTLEYCSKLPHFKMEFKDMKILKLTLKLAYVNIKCSNGNADKQLKLFSSFCKHFFKLEFNADRAKQLKEFFIPTELLKNESFNEKYFAKKQEHLEFKYLDKYKYYLDDDPILTQISEIPQTQPSQSKGDCLSAPSLSVSLSSPIPPFSARHLPTLTATSSLLISNPPFYLTLRFLHILYRKLSQLHSAITSFTTPPPSLQSSLPSLTLERLLLSLSLLSYPTPPSSLLSTQTYLLPILSQTIRSFLRSFSLLSSKQSQKLFSLYKTHLNSLESTYLFSISLLHQSSPCTNLFRIIADSREEGVVVTVHGLEDKERDGNKKWREKAGYLGEFVGKEVCEQTEGKIYLKRNLKYGRWVGRCGIVWELGKGGLMMFIRTCRY